VRTRFFVTVSSAPKSLARELGAALSSAVTRALEGAPPGAGSGTVPARVPHSVTDALVAADYRATKVAHTHYLVNPPAPPFPYVYSYPGGGCDGTLWVGKARYAWVDLAASPVAYGPLRRDAVSGGVVTPHTFPRPASFSPPGAALAAVAPPTPPAARRELVASLLGLVRSAAAQLLAPPLAHAPRTLHRHTQLLIVRITDAPAPPAGGGAGGAVAGLDTEVLRRELLGCQLGAAGLSVSVTELSLGSCDGCALALAASLRALAPTAGEHEAGLQAAERHIVDSRSLRAWMQRLAPAMQAAGLFKLADDGGSRTLPLYLFDLARHETLLLDGRHVALGFPDMALALRTRAGVAPLDAVCAAGTEAESDAFGDGGGAPGARGAAVLSLAASNAAPSAPNEWASTRVRGA